MTTTRLARAATAVALFTMVSRILGLFREIVMAASYGTTAATDGFVNALLLVNLVAAVVLYMVITVVIPVYAEERERAGEKSAWHLVWAYSAWVSLALIAMTAFIALFPQIPTALFHLDPTRAAITEQLVRIMAPALLLQGIAALLTALLQIYNKFAVPAAVGIVFNIGIIIGVLVGRGSIGIQAAAWGVTIGALAQVLLQMPQFLRLRHGISLKPVFTHPLLTAVLLTSIPVAVASVLQQINSYTDKLFASSLEAGRVTALNYANSLGAAPRAALLMPVLMPLFPWVANMIAEGRSDDALRGIDRINGLLALTAIPTGFLIALYSREITQLLLGRGHCAESCVHQTATPLAWYALATLGAFLTMFLNRALAAANLQRQILVATVWAVVVTIVFDLILLKPLAQGGIALASLIGIYLNVVLFVWYLRRHFPDVRRTRVPASTGAYHRRRCHQRGCRVRREPGPSDDRSQGCRTAGTARRQGRGRADRVHRGQLVPRPTGAGRRVAGGQGPVPTSTADNPAVVTPPPGDRPAASAAQLVKRYGTRVAVDHISFDIAAGECFGLLGPNGAGKSTTMRMMSCLTSRDGGELRVLGYDPDRDPRSLKRRIGVVAQDINLDLELSVYENLLVYANYFAIPRDEARRRADELLTFVRLHERRAEAVERLSGGMQRRLQIARALVNEPELVLLDEPTTGLDPQARHAVWDRLRDLRQRGATLVLTTHYMDEAEQLCDRIVIIDGGRVIRDGTPAGLIRDEVGREILELRASAENRARIAALDLPDATVQIDGDLVQIAGADAERLHERIRTAGIPAEFQSARRATLEDVFLRTTGRHLRDD